MPGSPPRGFDANFIIYHPVKCAPIEIIVSTPFTDIDLFEIKKV